MPDERGPIDWEALQETERIFRSRLGKLLTDVSYEPNAIDPVELGLTVGTGFVADSARFEVQWWEHHGYKYHYREERADRSVTGTDGERPGRAPSDGPARPVEFRFGWERRPKSPYPAKHFHPPDDLQAHRESCISHEDPTLVSLAVLACWWRALETGNPGCLNDLADPP